MLILCQLLHSLPVIKNNKTVSNLILTYFSLPQVRNRKIDINLAFPKTCKNIVKPLGVWDFDGHYEKFKTLGAKRYLTFNNGEYKLTCAGTSKNSVNYIKNNGGFDIFKIGLIIPKTESGRKISYYTDEAYKGEFVDYLGNKQTYEECSGLCLQTDERPL